MLTEKKNLSFVESVALVGIAAVPAMTECTAVQLRGLARQAGVCDSGRKAQLHERLCDWAFSHKRSTAWK